MKYAGTLGVVVLSFDRPKYLKQLITSLENQIDAGDVEYHLFQDGVKNKFSGRDTTSPSLTAKCVNMWTTAKLNKTTPAVVMPHNVGIAVNTLRAIDRMSEQYDYFIVLEDDVILSPYYIKQIRSLIPRIKDNVFSVSLNFRRMCKREDMEKNMDKLWISNDRVNSSIHWWGECYSSKNWERVRDTFMEYYKFVENVDYKFRPFTAIKQFFHAQGFNIPQTSQDAGRDYALFKHGMVRLNTVVNRGFYLGEYGSHFNPKLYKKYGFADMKPYIFTEDAGDINFTL